MRLLLDQRSYDEMLSKPSHPRDCYVRGAEYLHHLYADGVKYLVARAVYDCIKRAQDTGDDDALLHLMFHKDELEKLVTEARAKGVNLSATRALGDPPPSDARDVKRMSCPDQRAVSSAIVRTWGLCWRGSCMSTCSGLSITRAA